MLRVTPILRMAESIGSPLALITSTSRSLLMICSTVSPSSVYKPPPMAPYVLQIGVWTRIRESGDNVKGVLIHSELQHQIRVVNLWGYCLASFPDRESGQTKQSARKSKYAPRLRYNTLRCLGGCEPPVNRIRLKQAVYACPSSYGAAEVD